MSKQRRVFDAAFKLQVAQMVRVQGLTKLWERRTGLSWPAIAADALPAMVGWRSPRPRG